MEHSDIPPVTEFGDVSPCLAIAKKYSVDWAAPLYMVHLMVHRYDSGPLPLHNEMVSMVPEHRRDDFLLDCMSISRRIVAQHTWAGQHPCTFVNGEWVETL